MRRGDKKKGVVIVSITMGIIGIFLMNVFKRTLEQIPFVKKISSYKQVGVNSLKDFFELGELHLRLETFENGIIPLYDGVKVVWDSDESKEYTIILSNDHISKIDMLNCENIEIFKVEDVKDDVIWKRKIILTNKEIEEREQWDENLEEWHTTIKLEKPLSTYYVIPLENFYCRIQSSNGRISNELKYPTGGKVNPEEKIINAWVTKSKNKFYLHLKESKEYKIYNYKIVLYMEEGKGIIRTIPPFEDYIKVKLGKLPPCLCYVRGTRSVGAQVEEFIAWINQEKALQIEF